MKKAFSLLAVGALVMGSSLPASAHAFLDHAIPSVGAVIGKSPDAVKIWFTEEVEPAFSLIQVANAAGARVDKNDTHADAKDGAVLYVSLPALPEGTYKVSWQVVAKDTHKTQGTFPFTVKK